jgi:hypothetical protein
MPLPDLTDDERAELVRLLRDAIAADKYVLSPQVKRLKFRQANRRDIDSGDDAGHTFLAIIGNG